jgi:hypothetical protein
MAARIRRRPLGPGAHRFDESVALPRRRLDVARARAPVTKDRSQATDDNVEAVIDVDVRVGPQPALDLFTRDQLARPFEQQAEQIESLPVQPDGSTFSPQGPSLIVELEVSKRLDHGDAPF